MSTVQRVSEQNGSARRIVVVGNGMVGARFAEEVARLDPEGEHVHVTVVGAEHHPAYNRVLLSGVVAGDYTPDQIRLPVPETPGVSVRLGVGATALDTGRRRVDLDDGTHLVYDELVQATGARPGPGDPTFEVGADAQRRGPLPRGAVGGAHPGDGPAGRPAAGGQDHFVVEPVG